MKYIDADRLKAEIERKIAQYSDWAEEEWEDDREYNHGAFGAFKTVMRIVDSLQQEQPEVDLENYISNKLRELGADLINHKPYSFNRGLNVGKTDAYHDILGRLNARKEEGK